MTQASTDAARFATTTGDHYIHTVNATVRANVGYARHLREPDDQPNRGRPDVWTMVDSIADAATSAVARNAYAPDIRDAWGDFQIILEREVERWARRLLRKRQAGIAA